MTRILALNGASGATGAAFGLLTLSGGTIELVADETAPGRDGAERLPSLLADRLRAVGWTAASLGIIAVVVGPGSFTGLRASLSLAHGLALAGTARLVGVTVGETLGPLLQAEASGETIWCVSQARRDRVFIERLHGTAWQAEAAMLAALPEPGGSVLVGGDAAALVADALAAHGVAVRRSGLAAVPMAAIADASLSRLRGLLPPRAVQPLYVDPPEARLPQLRTAPT